MFKCYQQDVTDKSQLFTDSYLHLLAYWLKHITVCKFIFCTFRLNSLSPHPSPPSPYIGCCFTTQMLAVHLLQNLRLLRCKLIQCLHLLHWLNLLASKYHARLKILQQKVMLWWHARLSYLYTLDWFDRAERCDLFNLKSLADQLLHNSSSAQWLNRFGFLTSSDENGAELSSLESCSCS